MSATPLTFSGVTVRHDRVASRQDCEKDVTWIVICKSAEIGTGMKVKNMPRAGIRPRTKSIVADSPKLTQLMSVANMVQRRQAFDELLVSRKLEHWDPGRHHIHDTARGLLSMYENVTKVSL